ncbi:MAG: integrase, partial [Cytophagaceae bacterium]
MDQKVQPGHQSGQDFLQHIRFEKRLSHHTLTAYTKDLEQFCLFLLTECNIDQPELADFRHVRSWIVSLVEGKADKSSV